MTAEELLLVPDVNCRHELIAGNLVELPFCGMAHGVAGLAIGASLANYVRERRLGWTMMAAGFQVAWNPDTVLGADYAFVAAHRVIDTEGYYPGPPDLAIEVVNFDETCADVEHRADTWIASGTRLALVVDPHTEIVVSVVPEGKTRLTGDDVVTAGDVVRGWSLPVRDIFAE